MNSRSLAKVTFASQNIPGFENRINQFKHWMQIRQLSSKTFVGYARYLAEISLHFSKLPEDIQPEQYTDYLAIRVQNARSTSLSEFKQTVYGLRAYFKMLSINLPISLPSLKKDVKLPIVLNKHECSRLFDALNGKDKLMIMLTYSAGLRAGELVKMRWSDIDAQRMTLFIRRSKNRKDRYVPLSKALLRELISHPRPNKYPYLFSKISVLSPVTPSIVRRAFRKGIVKSGIRKPGACLHTLRHSYATHLLEDGLDIVSIKELLGHSRIETTLTYLQVAQIDRHRKGSPLDRLMPEVSKEELADMQKKLLEAQKVLATNEMEWTSDQLSLFE